MTKWTGHDGSSDCPAYLRGTRHKVEVVTYDGSGNAAVITHKNAGYRAYWGNVAAWRVFEGTLDERLLEYLEHMRAADELIEELKERIAKDD